MIKICNCTSNQFRNLIVNRKIICICAGINFRTFCESYSAASQIAYIVDNFKQGTSLCIEGREIRVVSMDQITEIDDKAVLVLTSVKAADEIIKQMDSRKVFDNRCLYIPEIFTEESASFQFQKDAEQKIPKIIHYFWLGNNAMPKYFQDNIDTWKKYCPEYEIRQWNERNYDISKNKYMLQAYESKKWGFVPDYARLDLIYSYGGIYFDTDVQLMKPLDPLLQFDLFCGFESITKVNFGQGFGAKKGHPVIKEMISEYENLEFIDSNGDMNLEPSPTFQTRTLEQFGLVANGRIQQKDDFIVFSPEYFSPVNQFGYGLPTENTFSIHQYAGSWYDEEQRAAKKKIIENYQYIMKRMKKADRKKIL